ncbi:MAG: DMT family transporter [Clostridia bacterium]|nr:DMT family transporter [Clostridia bacterium]
MNQKKFFGNRTIACALSLVCCLLWGSAFPCIKIGYNLLSISSDDTAAQILFAGLRFSLAGILTVIIGSIGARCALVPKKTSWGMVAKLCLAQTVFQYFFFYVGLANTTSVKSSIIKGTGTFISILIACFIFRQEKFTLPKLLGCTLGFGGILLINLPAGGVDGGFKATGEGFILLANVAGAVSTSLIKNYSVKENPVAMSGWQFFCGGLILAAAGLLMGGKIEHFPLRGILMIIYLACVSACAYSLWGLLLKHNRLSEIAVYGFMTPVFGVLLSALLMSESRQALSLRYLGALALVCLGIYIVNRFKGGAKEEKCA